MKKRFACMAALVILTCTAATAGELVPFRGSWHGQTISAEFQPPDIVFVVAAGSGQLTHLGQFTMISPHFNSLTDFHVWGEHNFTAADGSLLTASFDGYLAPTPQGTVEGTLPCTITGGTGRFASATGSYAFSIVATPLPGGAGFDSTATFDGFISTGDSNN